MKIELCVEAQEFGGQVLRALQAASGGESVLRVSGWAGERA
ncbi:hypothetical protein OG563_04880 [Nocardia vinacea]|uniref:Uncharacterized protein n=1 Tax=Nocardia vinacea TaxID=96468 RepID=A0ABZ1YWA9_9NOCA|nr:hypothetical protein [Nocardia vinacea]